MQASIVILVILFTLIVNAQVKNVKAGNDLMKQKAAISVEIGRLTEAQMNELAIAQNLYYKTYKQYPSGVEELIAKNFLRANFQTSRISKNITIDANNTIKTSNPKNATVKAYTDAHQNMINARDMKDKVTHNTGESIESRIEEF